MEDLLTLAEAAARLGLHPATLRKQVHNDVLAARLIGKTYVITIRELERYRREHLGHIGRPRIKKG